MTDHDALFDYHVPILKSSTAAYLGQIAGDYDGHPLWELAPIDPQVRRQYAVAEATTDFVWLLVDRRPVWALVDLERRTVIALDPEPLDKKVRETLQT